MNPEDFFNEQESKEQGEQGRVFWLNIINETVREVKEYMLQLTHKLLTGVKGNIFKVEVTNQKEIKFPTVQKVEVTNHKEDAKLYGLLEKAINKQIPEPKVTVNVPEFPKFPKLPETKVEIPKEFVVKNMGDIVREIQKIANKVPSTITVKQSIFDKTPRVEVKTDVKPFVDAIQALQGDIKKLLDKDTTIDQTLVIEAIEKVKHSLDTLEFPVPHSPSSWQKSKDMQSFDCDKVIYYRDDIVDENGNYTKINYVEFVDINGDTFKKTYTYDVSGRSTGWTRWVKQ